MSGCEEENTDDNNKYNNSNHKIMKAKRKIYSLLIMIWMMNSEKNKEKK